MLLPTCEDGKSTASEKLNKVIKNLKEEGFFVIERNRTHVHTKNE